MNEAYICDGIRTPIGRYGGGLASVRVDDLAAIPLTALQARNPQVDWTAVDDVILGCANQAGEDNRNVARMALLLAGLPESVTGITVNRLCASGIEAVTQAARAIRTGEAQLVIAGGVEGMSRAPYVMGKADSAWARNAKIEDTTMGWRFVNPQMQARFGVDPMIDTAENVAAEFAIARADQDAFALRSQQRCAAAQAAGRFAIEITPVIIKGRKGDTRVELDEHPSDVSDGKVDGGEHDLLRALDVEREERDVQQARRLRRRAGHGWGSHAWAAPRSQQRRGRRTRESERAWLVVQRLRRH